MTVMPDGNNRIQVVTMNSSHKNCCIVNVYMPSEAKEGDYEYKDNLDQLQEIIQKYDNSYQIIVCGDMNASLHRDDRRRDNLFRNFIHENGLKLANNHPERPTFFHHNGKYKSQIDYFLFKSTEHLNASVKIKEMDALNTSDHTLVLATVGVDVKRAAPKAAKILTKPRWEKCDHNIYKDCIQNEINNLEKEHQPVNFKIKQLDQMLHKAGAKAIPKYRKIKSLKTCGKGIWNSKISQKSKEAKRANWQWKNSKKTNSNSDSEKKEMVRRKRELRQLQRQAHASKKDNMISDIMQASENDSKTFHKLIRMQRSNSNINTDILILDGTKYTEDELMDGWKIHFEKLATPSMNDSFDVERQNLCKLQNYIISTSTNTKIPITPTTCKEVMNAVGKLNTGKSADENGIQAEHFRNAKEELAPLLCEIINQIFQDLDIPDSMKSGILTPILKKGKDKNIPGNYRGIVVTNTFSKILESIIKDRLEEQLKKTQNPLQRGFTEKASSKFTAFITAETIALYRKLNMELEVLTLDAEKAFDTVNHDIMFNKLYQDGVEGDMWSLMNNMYKGMTFKVKWDNHLTDNINIAQGIRQGAKLSTLLYKRYNNTILNSLTISTLGAKFGDIGVASPACADDIVLLGPSTEMQAMIDVVQYNTRRDLVKLNPGKTEVIRMAKKNNNVSSEYALEGQDIKRVQKLKHLGITYQENNKINLDERLKMGRQTIYALLGSGLHARSGMSPVVLMKIWNTYVVPRFLYGLEVQNPTKTDIKKLEQLQRKVCRQFQCLPERTSFIAVYALTGAEPIEVTLDKYCINLFFGIARLNSTIEKQMLLWESANANANDTLFINKIAGILEKYGMHTPMELLINPPSKHMGKTMIKKAINEYWYTKYNEEKSTKTTIRHLEIQKEPIGTPHNIWNCVKNQKLDIQKAEVKVKLVTDTYMLQYHQDKFSHKENAGFCKICNDGVEDIEHFILKCKPLDEVRQNKLEQFKRTVEDIKGGGAELLEEKNQLLQAILDCTSKNVYTIITNNHNDLKAIERASQNLCFELHRLRTKLYCELR